MPIKKKKDTILKTIQRKVVKGLFGNAIQEEASKRFTAAVSRETEDRDWRRITGKTRKRDLAPIKQDKMIKVMDFLLDRNPQAGRIIELVTDFILGDGLEYKFEDKEAQKVIDTFWKVNKFNLKQFTRVFELSLYGEQIYNTFINEFNGIVKIGSFDPEQVDKIEANPENAEELLFVVGKDTGEGDPPRWPIIRETGIKDKKTGKLTGETKIEGEVFFFPVNKLSHGTRGKADLLPIADWLDKYDKSLYTMTERINFLLAFLWDITMDGADEVQMRQRLQSLQMNKPKAGSFNLHNDKEIWKALSPDLQARDFTDFFKLVKTQLTSGSGLPQHWLFGTSEDINKASSKEISEPTYRKLKRRQTYIKEMFIFMFQFQIQQSIDKGILKKENIEDYPFTIILPDPSRKEAKETAETISTLVPALAIAQTNNMLSDDTIRKVTIMLINQLGLDIKVDDEEKKIKEPKEPTDAFSKTVNKVSDMLKDKDKKPEEKPVKESKKTNGNK